MAVTPRIVLATENAGKVREFEALFGGRLDVSTDGRYRAPVEDGSTYAANATLKADALASVLGCGRPAVLADDSGLEVAALDGAPGIYTARFGGTGIGWAQRRRELLRSLNVLETSDRRARFVCALHYLAEDGARIAVEGRYEGSIAPQERGDGGFSFDAIFETPDGRTFAELAFAEKNDVSHRARAVAVLLQRLVPRGTGRHGSKDQRVAGT